MLAKVFPIPLKPGKQAEAEAIVQEFAPNGPAVEEGTLSFAPLPILSDPHPSGCDGRPTGRIDSGNPRELCCVMLVYGRT